MHSDRDATRNTQRGNSRELVFVVFVIKRTKDHLGFLKKDAEKWSCEVMAYCLMGNHRHLLVKP